MSEVVSLFPEGRPDKPRHAETKGYRDLHALFGTCGLMRQIGVAAGPSGCGKTTAAMAFAASTPGATYIRLTATANTAQPFLVKLLTGIGGWAQPNLGKAELFDEAASFLRRYSLEKPVVIIDEMNLGTPELVHVLRDLWDAARCGLVLIGTEDMENLWSPTARRRAGRGDPFEAFRARIAQRLHLDRPGDRDVDALCAHLDLKGRRERDLIARCLKRGNGLHSLKGLLENAEQLAGAGKPVTTAHLEDAACLMGVK